MDRLTPAPERGSGCAVVENAGSWNWTAGTPPIDRRPQRQIFDAADVYGSGGPAPGAKAERRATVAVDFPSHHQTDGGKSMLRSLTALGTALVIAGAAHAQTGSSGNTGTTTGNPPASVDKGAAGNSGSGTMNRNNTGATGQNATGAVKNPAGAESNTGNITGGTAFDRSTVGQTVYDRDGEAIGQVKAAQGDRITVSVGEYLGVGSRDITLSRSQMDTKTGTSNKLITTLNKQELQMQPEASNTGNANTRSSNMPSDNTAKPMQRDGTSSTTTSPKK